MIYIIDRNSNKLPNVNNHYTKSNNERYKNNDLNSVYVHYNKELARNVPTENKLKGDD